MTPWGLDSCQPPHSLCVGLGVLTYEMGMLSPASQRFWESCLMLRLFIGEPCLTPHLLRKPHTESLGLEDFTVPAGCGIVAVDSLERILPWGAKHKRGLTVSC